MSNRNAVKQFFITFPNSSGVATKESFLCKIWTESQMVSFCVVEELHESGEPHLHANIKLRYATTKAKLLRKLVKCFPNDYKRIDVRPTRETPDRAREGYLSKDCNPGDCFYKKDIGNKRDFLSWLIYAGRKKHMNLVELCMFNDRHEELRGENDFWRQKWREEEGIDEETANACYARWVMYNWDYRGLGGNRKWRIR